MTPTEIEQVQIELTKLKKVCDQLKIDMSDLKLALPDNMRSYIEALILQEEKSKVSLLY